MSDTERMATLLRDALHAYYQSVDPRPGVTLLPVGMVPFLAARLIAAGVGFPAEEREFSIAAQEAINQVHMGIEAALMARTLTPPDAPYVVSPEEMTGVLDMLEETGQITPEARAAIRVASRTTGRDDG